MDRHSDQQKSQEQPEPYRHLAGSLYVGDLANDVTELDLYKMFSRFGELFSIKQPRDCQNNQFLGYAYVTFMDIDDAEMALDKLNYVKLKGREMRIMWSQRNPAQRRTGHGNIVIRNLCKTINSRALYDTFHAFGSILSCKVSQDPNGKSNGYGYIHFETTTAAEKAIGFVNGKMLRSKIVIVERFQSSEKQGGGKAGRFNNCYVKNIPQAMTEEQLEGLFNGYGKISSVKIMKDDDNNSRGFGFVCFKESVSAEKACAHLHNKEVEGKQLYVTRAQKKEERRKQLQKEFQGLHLYVNCLPENMTNKCLSREFGRYGRVASTRVVTESGKCKGYAFVSFSDAEAAAHAIRGMNGKLIMGKQISVRYTNNKTK